MKEPRPYQTSADLQRMYDLLSRGHQASPGAHYVHRGDLSWWLFYPTQPFDWGETIFLWEGDRADALLNGWALLSPSWRTFDLFTHPELYGSPQVEAMFIWAQERLLGLLPPGERRIRTMWIAQQDRFTTSLLERQGFRTNESGVFYAYMQRSLDGDLPEAYLPQGYCIRSVRGEAEAQRRAAASYAAFGSSRPFEAYRQRYLTFMRSPAYDPALDLVAEAPDGRIAAFCIIWPDTLTGEGLFEPVGTHPAYQRLGLGRALMLAGLRLLQQRGMHRAAVCTESDNLPAHKLYAAVGFQPEYRLLTYEKNCDDQPGVDPEATG